MLNSRFYHCKLYSEDDQSISFRNFRFILSIKLLRIRACVTVIFLAVSFSSTLYSILPNSELEEAFSISLFIVLNSFFFPLYILIVSTADRIGMINSLFNKYSAAPKEISNPFA